MHRKRPGEASLASPGPGSGRTEEICSALPGSAKSCLCSTRLALGGRPSGPGQPRLCRGAGTGLMPGVRGEERERERERGGGLD